VSAYRRGDNATVRRRGVGDMGREVRTREVEDFSEAGSVGTSGGEPPLHSSADLEYPRQYPCDCGSEA
jgi:hypothetical protein